MARLFGRAICDTVAELMLLESVLEVRWPNVDGINKQCRRNAEQAGVEHANAILTIRAMQLVLFLLRNH